MTMKIEDGVPIPAVPAKRFQADYKKMKIGQSFLVRNVDVNGARYAARCQETKIVVRRADDEHMRIWKTG